MRKRSKIRESAKGQPCQIQSQLCTGNREQTVFAHLNGGGGGRKMPDLFGAYSCTECHRHVDKLPRSWLIEDLPTAMAVIEFYEAVFRTQQILLEKGLVEIEGIK